MGGRSPSPRDVHAAEPPVLNRSTQPAPLISVALCVYNGERFLRAQLDSVLAQRDVQLDVVALDDASTDASGEILQAYAQRDQRVRCYRNPHNLGVTQSFERAMALARGSLIAPCDQDDLWEPGKLATLAAAIGTADLAYCDSAYVDMDAVPTGRRISDDIEMLAGTGPLRFALSNSVSSHAALVRRELFELARPFPADAFPDWWLAVAAAAHHGVVHVPDALVKFRRHGGALTTLGVAARASRSVRHYGAWLDQRWAILSGYARTDWRGHEQAQALLDALESTMQRQRRAAWGLLAWLWRARSELPGRHGAAANAVRWWYRFRRKVRRATREAAPGAD